MLKSLYVNNYKSLVNFQIEFHDLNLFLGTSGSGKSAVFEILQKLKLLLNQEKVDALFLFKELTRWQTSPLQRFEFTLELPQGLYKYELLIEFDKEKERSYIKSEALHLNQQVLLTLQDGMVQLYRDDSSKIAEYPFDTSQSAVALLPERRDNRLHTAFKLQMERLLILQPLMTAFNVETISKKESHSLDYYAQNFPSWYRYLRNDERFSRALTLELQEIMPDFDSFRLLKVGREEKILALYFKDVESKIEADFNFHELSDGQRTVILLYTLLSLAQHSDSTDYKYILCLDEPDNFLELREIQPWLSAIEEQCQTKNFQVVLISHHPEIINYLLAPSIEPIVCWFERESNVIASRLKPVVKQEFDLPPAELIARGWFDGD